MTPQQQVPLFDEGNPLIPLAETPALFTCKKLTAPSGELLAMTIRTQTATCTVLLTGKAAKAWARQFWHAADGMSETGLVTGNGTVTRP